VPPLIIFHEFVSSHLWFLAFDLAKSVVAKTNISQDQMQETINVMKQIHEILLKEAHND
jgi:hypothetical protein